MAAADGGDATAGVRATQASTVYDRLRVDILAGTLAPGARLRIESLVTRYRTGQIPLREALNRLSSDGLVERRDQRGFLVAPVSADDLREITKARCIAEGAALRESMAARTPAWEEGIVLAYHRLSRTPRTTAPGERSENPAWEPLHRAFHRSLIAACGSRWLLDFCMQLADQSYRYRQIAFQRAFPVRGSAHGHRAIVTEVLDGNADTAVRLLQAHVQFTAETILRSGHAIDGLPSVAVRALRRTRPRTPAKRA